jgi:Xaa-Pro aminopeptidase
MIFKKVLMCFLPLLLIGGILGIFGQNIDIADVKDSHNILPERERAHVMNEWLEWRLENILPELMERAGIDMWLVICREPNEDPVYLTLMPEPHMSAWRTSILIFHYQGPGKGVARYSGDKPSKGGGMHSIGGWYQGIWEDSDRTRFENLADFIQKIDPKKIGINVSELWSFGDGLSIGLKNKLERALDPKYIDRFVPAHELCIGWLETRSPQELSVYRHICGITHDIIQEFFSNQVIIPDITTTEDVVWWIRQKYTDLGLDTWFQPSISITRRRTEAEKYSESPDIIRRGDLLHCDMGITYLGLCTDMQWSAYVCRTGEDDAPKGLNDALQKLLELKEIYFNECRAGRTGNEITEAVMEKGKAAGLKPLIYTHPIGPHGHGAGVSMDARPPKRAPEQYRLRGDYPLYPNTVYAIEFSNTTTIPEWDNQELTLGFEDQGVFTGEGMKLVDGYQTKLLLIK